MRCATASPPICLSAAPIFASSRHFSDTRHTAREQPVEGRITYRFHPRYSETVVITRRLERSGVQFVVIRQPDSSLACLPVWMTQEAASHFEISDKPRFSLDILQSLRTEVDALLGFLLSESKTEEADNDAPIRKSPAEPFRGGHTTHRPGGRAKGQSGATGGGPVARDRNGACKGGGAVMTKITTEHLARSACVYIRQST